MVRDAQVVYLDELQERNQPGRVFVPGGLGVADILEIRGQRPMAEEGPVKDVLVLGIDLKLLPVVPESLPVVLELVVHERDVVLEVRVLGSDDLDLLEEHERLFHVPERGQVTGLRLVDAHEVLDEDLVLRVVLERLLEHLDGSVVLHAHVESVAEVDVGVRLPRIDRQGLFELVDRVGELGRLVVRLALLVVDEPVVRDGVLDRLLVLLALREIESGEELVVCHLQLIGIGVRHAEIHVRPPVARVVPDRELQLLDGLLVVLLAQVDLAARERRIAAAPCQHDDGGEHHSQSGRSHHVH